MGLVLGVLALSAPTALATGSGVGTTEITCDHVTFTYEGFPNAEGNTVNETVTSNHEVVASKTFTFNGPTGTDIVPIVAIPGTYLIDAHATWRINGFNGGFDHHGKVRCQAGFTIQKLQEIKGSGAGFTTSPINGKIGQTVDYEIVVKNIGLVPLTFSGLTDGNCDAGTIEGGPGAGAVAPGESTVFTCWHVLTAIGTYTNEASVTGTASFGPPITEPSNKVVVNVPFEPEFSIQKLQELVGSGLGFTTAPITAGLGETIDYEIVVTNTGNVPLTFSEFVDAHCASIAGGPGAGQLGVGESSIYTCNHILTEKDVKKGPYENTAKVKAAPPVGEGNPVSHTSNTVIANILGGTGTTEFSCTKVVFHYTGFPNAEGNTVMQTISVEGTVISTTTFVFNGPSGSDTVSIKLPEGKHVIDVHVTWHTNGANGGFDHHARVICESGPG